MSQSCFEYLVQKTYSKLKEDTFYHDFRSLHLKSVEFVSKAKQKEWEIVAQGVNVVWVKNQREMKGNLACQASTCSISEPTFMVPPHLSLAL